MAPSKIVDIPNKKPDGCLDWSSETSNRKYLTNIDIDRIRMRGGAVEVVKGIFWRQSWKPFEVLKTFRDEKMRQGRLKSYAKMKRSGMDKIYFESCLPRGLIEKPNAAIRTCCKLLMNSLFGKMLERATNYEYIDVSDCRFNDDGSIVIPK